MQVHHRRMPKDDIMYVTNYLTFLCKHLLESGLPFLNYALMKRYLVVAKSQLY